MYTLGISSLASFLVALVTGWVKMPYIFPVFGITYASPVMGLLCLIHDWSGIVFGDMRIMYIAAHRKWFVSTTHTALRLML